MATHPALADSWDCTSPVNARAGGSPTGTGTMKLTTLPSRDEIRPDTPLRLRIAAALAFPDGSMTASGLRRESARGRLVVERIAGKDYTTLANIERMRELCRVEAKGARLYLRQRRGRAPHWVILDAGSESAQQRAKMISAKLKKL